MHVAPPLCLLLLLLAPTSAARGARYRDCGGVLNATHGVISTPNFPHAFPTPIECRWLIRSRPGKKIVVYFTQYYLRGGLFASEYDLYMYSDESLFVGRNNLGELETAVLGEPAIVSLTAYKPYLLLRLDIRQMDNMNIRVEQYMRDVYGFNITYE
ncbi:PREDICTED: CUB and sushi domain-containing protein 3-like, partial [Priapulus caudatus]|uniref:CUB and sushi domain-containing protein 3-like n=1 Tax=Priapulus caudatus TaxID=37621 RepID=A0ABM1F7J2_PRICU